MVLNLISNALKFTSSGEVTVSASVQQHDAASYLIAIEVRDTGIGIAPDQLSRLFSSFSQADASISRRFGGTGLGLAISKRLVELMGGAMRVESQPGQGTSFRFTVSLAAAQEPVQAHIADAPMRNASSLKVLVAEDNPVNQLVVLKMLAKLGVRADLVTDGRQAVIAVSKACYDLVLMDVQMPEMDGLTATQQIRNSLAADLQPAIFGLTAHAAMEYRDICLRAGMNGCLTKPIEPEKLRGLIAELSARVYDGLPGDATTPMRRRAVRSLMNSVTSRRRRSDPAWAVGPAEFEKVSDGCAVIQALCLFDRLRIGKSWSGRLGSNLQKRPQ